MVMTILLISLGCFFLFYFTKETAFSEQYLCFSSYPIFDERQTIKQFQIKAILRDDIINFVNVCNSLSDSLYYCLSLQCSR